MSHLNSNRSKKKQSLNFEVSDEMANEIREISKRTGISQAFLFRKALENIIIEYGVKKWANIRAKTTNYIKQWMQQ